MKNPVEVLRMKEQELLRVKKEIEALRITARLLDGENRSAPQGAGKPAEKVDVRELVKLP